MSEARFLAWLFRGMPLFCALVAGCSSSTDGKSNVRTEVAPPGTWIDPATQLMWQEPQFVEPRAWGDAVKACDSLALGGFDDWRLPSLDELRSLARGCNATATGGSCRASEQCLETSCFSVACDGCSEFGGLSPDGCYRPESLTGDCMTTWTSAAAPDLPDHVWTVGFGGCHVRLFPKSQNNLNTRCVR